MSSPIITLTTDLGNKDYYVPSVKGFLLSKLPAANITDITHQIKAFRIDEASFVLHGCYREFPRGSIHIVSVDNTSSKQPRYLAVKANEHFFLCPDNGIISLVIKEGTIDEVVEIPYEPASLAFPLKNILAPAAITIVEWGGITSIGAPVTGYDSRSTVQPLTSDYIIKGVVIHIDNLGNAVTNIDRESLDRFSKGRDLRIMLGPGEYLDRISLHYNEVLQGEVLCLFGGNGLLKIAINNGNSSQLLGMRLGTNITIEFL